MKIAVRWLCFEVSTIFVFSVYICRALANFLSDVESVDNGAIPGRTVSVSGKVYRQAFKASLVLGQCPLVMNGSTIVTCTESFTGEEVFVARGQTRVSVTRVQSSEDVLLRVMGAVGTSGGILGLVSVNPKVSVAVTTQTTGTHLHLLSSYDTNRGLLTLLGPRPSTGPVGKSGALFLSEIELGGEELFMVTLQFETERLKTEVEVSVAFKILFVTITAKMRYAYESLKAKASVRIQFQSSWRPNLDESFSHLQYALPRVEEVEKMFVEGPALLAALADDDPQLHNVYHFSSWWKSPYEGDFNEAVIRRDLETLTEQNAEIRAVIHRIHELEKQVLQPETRRSLMLLNQTLSVMAEKLTVGLDTYHQLSDSERVQLTDIYGQNRAPLYYNRRLKDIVS